MHEVHSVCHPADLRRGTHLAGAGGGGGAGPRRRLRPAGLTERLRAARAADRRGKPPGRAYGQMGLLVGHSLAHVGTSSTYGVVGVCKDRVWVWVVVVGGVVVAVVF